MDVDELVSALKKPDSYDENTSSVTMVQTHISFVFLTDRFVYKVKKPVDFGFLDYTTLDKRKHYCEEEIRLNRPLCGDMYVGVSTVNLNAKGEVKIDGDGAVVEYAVKMRRLPDDAIMTELLKNKKVGKKHLKTIAQLLAEFHKNAKTGAGVDECGTLEQIHENWVQNFEQTKPHRGSLIPAEKFDYVEKKILAFMEKNKDLFNERVQNHRIRQCHGDVHSGNIFILQNGETYIFDAIEFFKGFSCCDVASEIAFLAMDLEFQGEKELSDYFVKEYIGFGGDGGVKGLLDFYRCYRAYVRAKVIGFKVFDTDVGLEEKNESKTLVKEYFGLAHSYASRL